MTQLPGGALGIAIEHVRWAQRQGLTPEQVLEGLGVKVMVKMSWPRCAHILAALWEQDRAAERQAA